MMEMSHVFGPKHHGGSDDPFETIKVLEAWLTPDEMIGFCKGQSIVYQRRHRAKGGLEDLAKSAWYQNYLVGYLAKRGLSGYGPTSTPAVKSESKSGPQEAPGAADTTAAAAPPHSLPPSSPDAHAVAAASADLEAELAGVAANLVRAA